MLHGFGMCLFSVGVFTWNNRVMVKASLTPVFCDNTGLWADDFRIVLNH